MTAFFLDQGTRTGTPIVLIHGYPFDHTMWEPQVQALKTQCRVITYDVRGLGRSPAGDAPATMDQLADDLFALLDVLRMPAAVLCGLSLGGYIVLRAIERAPQRALGLILADTRSQPDTDEARQARLAAIRQIEAEGLKNAAEDSLRKVFAPRTLAQNKPCVDAIRKTILKNDPQGVCFAAKAIMSRADTTPALARIKVRALVMAGEHDSLTPPAVGQAMAQAIPEARFVQIPDAGHLSSLENPAAFNKHILDYLLDLPQ
ncbi:MAG: alpha/beta fold hydrolase [Elusimicrobia bacterium]|nr:alpha/beta fold hydrolase [Elusimicrobiota bacterium]